MNESLYPKHASSVTLEEIEWLLFDDAMAAANERVQARLRAIREEDDAERLMLLNSGRLDE